MKKEFNLYEWTYDNQNENRDTYIAVIRELNNLLYEYTGLDTYKKAIQELQDNLEDIFLEEEEEEEDF